MSGTRKITRRKFFYTGAAAAAGLAIFSADGLAQTYDVHVVKLDISLKRLPKSFDGFTIAQLSDFHYDDRFSTVPIHKCVPIVNQLHPDLIVLTGDFITVPLVERGRFLRAAVGTALPCAEALGGLHGPKFAILGNHDAMSNPPEIIRFLETNGISVMRNRSVPLERGGNRIWLAGIDDLLRGMPSIWDTLRGIPPDEATILLAHEPDYANDASRFPVDLQLSGHSHGGQIWLPLVGAPWLPPMGRRYPRGLYTVRDLTLYTNMGLGTIRAPIRINCPPEVTFLTLRSVRG